MVVTRREFMTGTGAVLATSRTVKGFPFIVQPAALKVGVFISERDAQGVDELLVPYVSQMRIGLELAASEINAMGGIRGRGIELVYRDDGGSPASRGATEALVGQDGCEAIISGFVMASPRIIANHLASLGVRVPVLHGFWSEGSYCGPLAKYFAPTARQIVPLIRSFLGDDFRARPFSISNWTPTGRKVSDYLYGALGGPHTGDALVTTPVLGNHPGEYRGLMRWAHEVESNIIWNADPRPYAVNAVNQAVELGVSERKIFAYLDFSEWQASRLLHGASILTCVPFVANDRDNAVRDFVSRAGRMSGGELVTHVAYTHYNALMALKAAMDRSGEASALGGLAGFDGLTIETATGPLMLNGHGYPSMPMFIAAAEDGGPLTVVRKIDQAISSMVC